MSRRKKVQPRTIDGQLNPDVNKHEYDLRPNLGQSDNSQGTLFQVTKRPRNTVGHRGFSAERQDEVQRMVYITTSKDFNREVRARASGDVVDTVRPAPPEAQEQYTRAVQDAIARSTAPIASKADIRVLQPQHPELRGHKGFWTEGGIGVSTATFKPNTGPKGKQWDSPTIRHELGHHFQLADDTTPGPYSDEKRGDAEAFADDFMIKHSPKGNKGQDYEFTSYNDLSDPFRSVYDASRTTPMYELQALPSSPHVITTGRNEHFHREVHGDSTPTLPVEVNSQRMPWHDPSQATPLKTRQQHIDSVENRQINGIRQTLGLDK